MTVAGCKPDEFLSGMSKIVVITSPKILSRPKSILRIGNRSERMPRSAEQGREGADAGSPDRRPEADIRQSANKQTPSWSQMGGERTRQFNRVTSTPREASSSWTLSRPRRCPAPTAMKLVPDPLSFLWISSAQTRLR